jgi:hypothetical protein
VEKIMHNAYPIVLVRDVAWNEIVPVGKNVTREDGLKIADIIINHREEQQGSRLHYRMEDPRSMDYLLIKSDKPAVLINPSKDYGKKKRKSDDAIVQKAMQMVKEISLKAAEKFIKKKIKGAEWEEKLEVFSIPLFPFPDLSKVQIPKGAVPAIIVKKYDNDFNCTSYYIPEDAIKARKD